MDDIALVKAFQAGDDAAFTELVKRHERHVYRVVRSVVRTHSRSDEAAQEAFVKAYRGLHRFEGKSSFRTWLHRIAKNAALDLVAREGTQDRVRAEAEAEARAHAVPAVGPRPLDALIREERRQALRKAIDRLPERQRLTLTLRVDADLKYAEIAEVLGCPVGTVKANFHHAVRNLQRLLTPEPTGDRQALTDAKA